MRCSTYPGGGREFTTCIRCHARKAREEFGQQFGRPLLRHCVDDCDFVPLASSKCRQAPSLVFVVIVSNPSAVAITFVVPVGLGLCERKLMGCSRPLPMLSWLHPRCAAMHVYVPLWTPSAPQQSALPACIAPAMTLSQRPQSTRASAACLPAALSVQHRLRRAPYLLMCSQPSVRESLTVSDGHSMFEPLIRLASRIRRRPVCCCYMCSYTCDPSMERHETGQLKARTTAFTIVAATLISQLYMSTCRVMPSRGLTVQALHP